MASHTPKNPKIDSQTFVAVMWSGNAISLAFLAFRIFVRIKSFRRIYADDVLVLIAWLLFFVRAVIGQSQLTAMYQQFALSKGTFIPTPAQLEAERTFLRSNVATVFLYYTVLWTVKLSFLVFFRRLGQKVRGQKIWWWCVTGFTIATWAACIGTIGYKCLLGSLDYIFAECAGPSAQKFQWANLVYICAVDVITDAAIITIPILMLWNVRISWKKKLALMSIFSLTVIVIIVSIVRVTVVNTKNSTPDQSWMFMWSNIEVAVSIVVSCLASFRQLFVKSEKSGFVHKSENVPFWLGALLSIFKSSKRRSSSSSSNGSSSQNSRRHGAVAIPDSAEHLVPLDTVYVSHDHGK
ncbi:hypothetical protein MMC22_002474 [Lobaria immixta]|nr:hypothetical protein [Lobaria immixta]